VGAGLHLHEHRSRGDGHTREHAAAVNAARAHAKPPKKGTGGQVVPVRDRQLLLRPILRQRLLQHEPQLRAPALQSRPFFRLGRGASRRRCLRPSLERRRPRAARRQLRLPNIRCVCRHCPRLVALGAAVTSVTFNGPGPPSLGRADSPAGLRACALALP